MAQLGCTARVRASVPSICSRYTATLIRIKRLLKTNECSNQNAYAGYHNTSIPVSKSKNLKDLAVFHICLFKEWLNKCHLRSVLILVHSQCVTGVCNQLRTKSNFFWSHHNHIRQELEVERYCKYSGSRSCLKIPLLNTITFVNNLATSAWK